MISICFQRAIDHNGVVTLATDNSGDSIEIAGIFDNDSAFNGQRVIAFTEVDIVRVGVVKDVGIANDSDNVIAGTCYNAVVAITVRLTVSLPSPADTVLLPLPLTVSESLPAPRSKLLPLSQ